MGGRSEHSGINICRTWLAARNTPNTNTVTRPTHICTQEHTQTHTIVASITASPRACEQRTHYKILYCINKLSSNRAKSTPMPPCDLPCTARAVAGTMAAAPSPAGSNQPVSLTHGQASVVAHGTYMGRLLFRCTRHRENVRKTRAPHPKYALAHTLTHNHHRSVCRRHCIYLHCRVRVLWVCVSISCTRAVAAAAAVLVHT